MGMRGAIGTRSWYNGYSHVAIGIDPATGWFNLNFASLKDPREGQDFVRGAAGKRNAKGLAIPQKPSSIVYTTTCFPAKIRVENVRSKLLVKNIRFKNVRSKNKSVSSFSDRQSKVKGGY
jgi:hypothetical protein